MKKALLTLVFLMLMCCTAASASGNYSNGWATEKQQGHLLESDLTVEINHQIADNDSTYEIRGEVGTSANFPTEWAIDHVKISAVDAQGDEIWSFEDHGFWRHYIDADGYGYSEEFGIGPVGKMSARYYKWDSVARIKVEAWVYDYSTGDTIILPLDVPFTP